MQQQAWNIKFEGEGSIDAGGPYRESITQVAGARLASALVWLWFFFCVLLLLFLCLSFLLFLLL